MRKATTDNVLVSPLRMMTQRVQQVIEVGEERVAVVEETVTNAVKTVKALRATARKRRRMTIRGARTKSMRNLVQRTMDAVGASVDDLPAVGHVVVASVDASSPRRYVYFMPVV